MSRPATRVKLPELGKTSTHPRLLMDRYVPSVGSVDKGSESSIAEFLENVASIAVPASYSAYYGNWKTAVQAVPNTHILEGTTAGPLAIGLGNDTSLEVGLTLHHTYGTPIIPGSALKGLAVRAASSQREALGKNGMTTLFGAQESASLFVFWDALLVSGTEPHPLQPDIVTVHHPAYYSTQGTEWPTDFDDPTPVPFMTIKPGTKFSLAVSGPDDEWCRYAMKLLTWGLENLGIGGKTNAGYGRFAQFAPLPEPPKVTTTHTVEGCTVIQRNIKGAISGEITMPGLAPITVKDPQWSKLRKEGGFTEEHLNQMKKRKPVTVTVTATKTGDEWTVESISV